MKKLSLVLVLFLLCFSTSYAQAVPQGMKYQAVARNLAGVVIADQEIALKISLLTKGDAGATYYTEVHTVTTNQLGLFNLVIGEGKVEIGSFRNIPWSTDDVWMQVAIKDKGKPDFAIISSSKLLAVPYAFHAGTASEVTGTRKTVVPYAATQSGGNASGLSGISKEGVFVAAAAGATTPSANTSNGNSWNAGGNLGTNPSVNYLGTADNVALVIKTNAIERMRITADGNASINKSLTIGEKLTVDGATLLNTSLTVNGPTDLNSRLNVNQKSPTTLTGTLNVKGITDLDSALNVNGKNPTVLTGTLRVDSNTVFNSPTNSDTSLASPNGALAIYGGVGIAKNATIGGDVRIGGKTTLAGPLRITDQTPSTSDSTGALTVGGGVGIRGQLNVGGVTNLADSLKVIGVTALKNITQSTNTKSGALLVSGGVGIDSSVNIGGALTAAGVTNLNSQVTITANPNPNLTQPDRNRDTYPLRVQGSGQGIAVTVNGSRTSGNNFMSFWDANGMQGRIEGQTPTEMYANPDYILDKKQYEGDIAFGTIDLLLAGYNEAYAITGLVAASSSSTGCVGLGACVTAPIPSIIAHNITAIVIASVNLAATITAVAFTGVNFDAWKDLRLTENGITYESGAGDYAEYLKREQQTEQFVAGDIVAVKGGKISKNTMGADKIMVISSKPIVLGNMPSPETAKDYEKVAFLGQVPVKVFGVVNVGDYILPNGNNNGVGVAVSKEKITSKDIKNIVGIAWSSSSQPVSIAIINVAVGLNVNDNHKFVEELEKQIADLKGEISTTNIQLEKLVPGFKASSMVSAPGSEKSTIASLSNNNKNESAGYTMVPDETNIIYYQPTRAEYIHGIEHAQKDFTDNGGVISTNPFWKKYNGDASFKEEFVSKLMKKLDKGIAQNREIDKSKSNSK